MSRTDFSPKLGLTLPLCGLNFVFFFLVTSDAQKAYGLFAFIPEAALAQPWRFLTYQFLTSSPLSLFFGTMMLYILGSALEAEWGTAEFTVFWLVATLGTSLTAWAVGSTLVSGWAVLDVSLLFAYAYLFPETVFYIFMILPVKVKWIAWLTAAYLAFTVFSALARGGLRAGLAAGVEVSGMAAGFLYFWIRRHGIGRARRASKTVAEAVKSAGAIRDDQKLERRNRDLFPRVEALRQATKGGGALAPAETALQGELRELVVAGVKICKPVDFKGDKDGICIRCEGFAECSLRYVAGQPEEIVFRPKE